MRGEFEQRFGADFSAVRVHNDGEAHAAARSIDARAFTVGNHIAFGEGQYEPSSAGGKKLLAHELTHVLQQSGSRTDSSLYGSIGPAAPGVQRAMAGLCIFGNLL